MSDEEIPDWLDFYVKQLREMLGGREPSEATVERVRRCHHFLCRMSVTKIPMVQLAALAAVEEEIAPATAPVQLADPPPKKKERTKAGDPPPDTPRAESMRQQKPEVVSPFEDGQKVVSQAGGVPLGGVFKKLLPNNKALVRVNDRDISLPLESLSAVNG